MTTDKIKIKLIKTQGLKYKLTKETKLNQQLKQMHSLIKTTQ